jgi:hypothetical protein
MANIVRIDLARDEILTTHPTIGFGVPEDADEKLVPRVAGVKGVDGRVRPTRGRGKRAECTR